MPDLMDHFDLLQQIIDAIANGDPLSPADADDAQEALEAIQCHLDSTRPDRCRRCGAIMQHRDFEGVYECPDCFERTEDEE